MTQSIDQAPNNNPDHNGGGDERADHPELVSRGSQSLLGGEIPANLYEPAPLDRDPHKKTRRNLFIAAGATIGTVAATGALYLGAKHEVRDIANDLYNPLPASSAPAIPGQTEATIPTNLGEDYNHDGQITKADYDLMPPEVYMYLAEKVQTQDNAAEINQYLQSAFDTMKPFLSPEEARLVRMSDLDKPRDQWTDQEYYNNHALELWLASTQGSTQQQINEGRRTLPSVIDPDHPGYTTMDTAIGQASAIRNVCEALSDEFVGRNLQPGTIIDGIIIDESGGRLSKGRWLGNGVISYDVFVNRTDDQGNVITRLARSYSSLQVPELRGVI